MHSIHLAENTFLGVFALQFVSHIWFYHHWPAVTVKMSHFHSETWQASPYYFTFQSYCDFSCAPCMSTCISGTCIGSLHKLQLQWKTTVYCCFKQLLCSMWWNCWHHLYLEFLKTLSTWMMAYRGADILQCYSAFRLLSVKTILDVLSISHSDSFSLWSSCRQQWQLTETDYILIYSDSNYTPMSINIWVQMKSKQIHGFFSLL